MGESVILKSSNLIRRSVFVPAFLAVSENTLNVSGYSSASFVNSNGKLALNSGLYNWACIAVRPALWVKL